MAWMRVPPHHVLPHLRAEASPDDVEVAQQALAHLRERLLDGTYVVIQHGDGRLFIGTEQEAVEHMMENAAS